MEVFIGEQLKTLAESFILGLIFGAGYDIIRIIHIICGIASYSGESNVQRGKFAFILYLLFDIVFMVLIAFSYSVFLYHNNNGIFRLHLFIACFGGFVLYYQSIGKLVMRLSETNVHVIKAVVYTVFLRPAKVIFTAVYRLIVFIVKRTVGKLLNMVYVKNRQSYMRKIKRKMPVYIKF